MVPVYPSQSTGLELGICFALQATHGSSAVEYVLRSRLQATKKLHQPLHTGSRQAPS
ncbi:unnamed protein product [Brassica napus]|uniref:(rape) hypothetical protein n=1 Tax=Brassica napus TaxID=3708 RepID=A0A816S3D1_BRANA|nr:unnamed protein product [Brassica napus]